jgi:hypothetical protein
MLHAILDYCAIQSPGLTIGAALALFACERWVNRARRERDAAVVDHERAERRLARCSAECNQWRQKIGESR